MLVSIASSLSLPIGGQSVPEPADERAAQIAVYELRGIDRQPPAVYRGGYAVQTVFKAHLSLRDARVAT